MSIEVAFGAIFLLFVVQVIGTYLQVKEYKKAVRELHKLGNVGIGSGRKKLGAGSVVIIACKSDGRITGGSIMRGVSIFSRFNPMEDIVGKTIYELKAEYESMPEKNRSQYKGHIQAIEALELRLAGEAPANL